MKQEEIRKELAEIRKQLNSLNNSLTLFVWKIFGNSEPDELDGYKNIQESIEEIEHSNNSSKENLFRSYLG